MKARNIYFNINFAKLKCGYATRFDSLTDLSTDLHFPFDSVEWLVIAFKRYEVIPYSMYLLKAIKFSALDYLLKPSDIEELKKATTKAIDSIEHRRKDHSLDNLLEYIKRGKQDLPKIALPALTEIMYASVGEIIRCEASNNYTNFFLALGGSLLVCKTVKEFTELLKLCGFLRTHQSHLVNIQFVKSYLKEDGGTLLMRDRSKYLFPGRTGTLSRRPQPVYLNPPDTRRRCVRYPRYTT